MKQQSIIFEEELRQVQFSDSKSIKNKFLQKMRKPQNLDGYNQMRKFHFNSAKHFMKIDQNVYCAKIITLNLQLLNVVIHFVITAFLNSYLNLMCPCCQTVLKGLHFIQCHTIDEFIKNSKVLVKNSTIPSRKKQFKEWKLKKKITNFNIGDTLDVLDTEHIWCVGSIINILNQKKFLSIFKDRIKLTMNTFQSHLHAYPLQDYLLIELVLFNNQEDILLYYPSQDENSMFNQIRQIGSQNQENELYNYLIIQQQTANSNIILAVEQPNRIGLQSLLQLVVFIREIQDELYNET